MRQQKIWPPLLLAGLLASGCSVPPAAEQPGGSTGPARPGTSSSPAVRQPGGATGSALPGTSSSPAVVELSSQARRAFDSRQFDAAVQLLERAINIDPRNGSLWHELARARYAQGNYEQAIQLAKRSNALPNVGSSLKSRNDELIQASRHALGD